MVAQYSGTVVIPIGPYSDGDAGHRPRHAEHVLEDPPTGYLEKLAVLWMKKRGEYQEGVTYSLDRLPLNYTVWAKSRKNNPQHIDRWAYGHPSGKLFDSVSKFFTHFLHLMNHKSNIGCPCAICSRGTTERPLAPTEVGMKSKGRARQVDTSELRTDEEGTPDIYRNLIDKLRRNGQIDEYINETMSLDWRAERTCLPQMLSAMSSQNQWVPRLGEMVLFVRSLPAGASEIRLDQTSGKYKIWSSDRVSCPCWEAGVVTQTAAETPCLADLIRETSKQYHRNYSGLRVEPMPDPNSTDKRLSKQHKYLPLSAIRPFAFYLEFLCGVRVEETHPTIRHAITAMSSLSLVEKYRFSGTWPTASISCRGVYIGSELILCGDTVRLTPRQQSIGVTDILQITSIQLSLTNLDTASDDDDDQGHPYNSAVQVTGKGFTLDVASAATSTPLTEVETRGLSIQASKAHWYRLHAPDQSLRLHFTRIIGRCFEEEALALWFPLSSGYSTPMNGNEQKTQLSRGVDGVLQARQASSREYRKIDQGKSWFWGDSRVEALDLATVNGHDVAGHDKSRNPRLWRRLIKKATGVTAPGSSVAKRPLRATGSAWQAVNMPMLGQRDDTDDDDELADDVIGLAQSDEEQSDY